MYKLFIADDEPKIRRGLRKLKWDLMDIQVVGEAADGEEAYEKVIELKPDLMLVDINMPVMNGLELVEKIKKVHWECLIIIVSGYDEFDYAKRALQHNVFDYVLKPVKKAELFKTIERGLKTLETSRKKEDMIKWATSQVVSNQEQMIENFFKKWIAGGMTDYAVNQNLQVLDISMDSYTHMLIIHVLPIIESNHTQMDEKLVEFCILNIINETMETSSQSLCVKTQSATFVVFFGEMVIQKKITLIELIKENLYQYLNLYINIQEDENINFTDNFRQVYFRNLEELKKLSKISPLAVMAKSYIENNFHNCDLSVDDVAKHTRVSSSYLSKVLKKELGLSYSEQLIKIRIERGIQLMADPLLRIYDIAERTGFSSQHYFSTAFKKIKGVSPATYRKDKYHYE